MYWGLQLELPALKPPNDKRITGLPYSVNGSHRRAPQSVPSTRPALTPNEMVGITLPKRRPMVMLGTLELGPVQPLEIPLQLHLPPTPSIILALLDKT